MKLHNTFAVTAPIEEVWAALMDVDKVASCVPGAQVLEVLTDDSYVVGMKVKLGPITMQYRGQMDVVMRDEVARRASLRGKAKETRGQGTAEATVELALTQQDRQTNGTVEADVRLSGKAAAMGQGVIASVADQMLGQFAHNLEVMLNDSESSKPAAEVPADDERSGDNVVEAVETLASGTQHKGVQTSPSKAKSRRAPVEQVRGDEEMTEGQDVTGSSGSGDADGSQGDPVATPTRTGESGAAQSTAGARESDRVSAQDRRPPAATRDPARHSGSDDGDSLDGLAIVRSMLSGLVREHRQMVALVGGVAVISYLLGRSTGRRN